MVKNISFFLAFFLIASTLFAESNPAAEDSSWKQEFYREYDSSKFSSFPPALERIDFEAVDYPLLDAALFYETNSRRMKNGLPPFTHSAALESAAARHSRNMVRLNFFSHSSPVPGEETMSQRLAREGISGGYRGENIGISFGIEYESGRSIYTPPQNGGYFSYSYKGEPIKPHTYIGLAKAALDSWMNSPGHRANILNPHFRYLGTGAAFYGRKDFFNIETFKTTQNFSSSDAPD